MYLYSQCTYITSVHRSSITQMSNSKRKPKRISNADWISANLRPADGRNAREPLRLERWQDALLRETDSNAHPVICVVAAAQVGKTLISMGLALRSSCEGHGTILASSTETSVRDLARRLESAIEDSETLREMFPPLRSGPHSRSTWKDRRLSNGGFLSFASAGSASELASRTCHTAFLDELSRFPSLTKSREGFGLDLIRARLFDYGDDSRLVCNLKPGSFARTLFQNYFELEHKAALSILANLAGRLHTSDGNL